MSKLYFEDINVGATFHSDKVRTVKTKGLPQPKDGSCHRLQTHLVRQA